MKPTKWLLKTEPETYSVEQLKKDRKTNWNGVRNFQARNFLRQMEIGDLALIYHSGKDRAVVGIAQVSKAAFPELDEEGKEWAQVEVKFEKDLTTPVTLAQIKANPALKHVPMLKQGRLSVMPISDSEFELISRLGNEKRLIKK